MVEIDKDMEKEMAEIEWQYIQSLVDAIDKKNSLLGVNVFVAIFYI